MHGVIKLLDVGCLMFLPSVSILAPGGQLRTPLGHLREAPNDNAQAAHENTGVLQVASPRVE